MAPIVERLRSREAMATPAPWQMQDGNSHRRVGVPGRDGNVIRPARYSQREPHVLTLDGDRIYADLMLAIEARNALPALLDTIELLVEALEPFAEPHAMGDNYVQFAPRLIEAARSALAQVRADAPVSGGEG